MVEILFSLNLMIRYLEITGIVFSIAHPQKRIWPPPKKQSWQFYVTWLLFYSGVVLTAAQILITWNTWVIQNEIRFLLGIPFVLLGGFFVLWGISSLGVKNTHGIKNTLIVQGIYKFTRNPQYLGDIILFFGLSLLVNSVYVAIPLLLQAIIFAIAPFSEELWLTEQYGNKYTEYKNKTSRFL